MIIDATNLIAGRLASHAAKKALLGEQVDIVNAGDAVITGRKETVFGKYNKSIKKGRHSKGPFYNRRSDMFLRRLIRGMLPYKQEKGEQAFKRIMCYVNVPEKFQGKKLETLKDADVSKVPSLYYIKISEIVKLLGGKI
jgi:large subunit ribosomal protein L13